MFKNNKNRTILLALFLLTVAAGVYYPAAKIISFEFPSSPPAVFRFPVTLFDPYDLFRGRYVQLNVENQTLAVKEEDIIKKNNAYAVLEKDENGFAVAVSLVPKPEPGKPAIRVRSFWRTHQARQIEKEASIGSKDVSGETYLYEISFPFDRFYMNEKLAPEAERVVRDALLAGDVECVIVVNVYASGHSTITDLLVGGTPIHELLKNERAEQKR